MSKLDWSKAKRMVGDWDDGRQRMPRAPWRTMPAQYPGWCTECNRRVRPGAMINWAKGKGVKHLDCLDDGLCPVCRKEGKPRPQCLLCKPNPLLED